MSWFFKASVRKKTRRSFRQDPPEVTLQEADGGWSPYVPHETPLKINMEHNPAGLEDHFSFQMGDGCRFQPLIFQGVKKLPWHENAHRWHSLAWKKEGNIGW